MKPLSVMFLLGLALFFWSSRVHAVEPYLPPHSAVTTWRDLYRDQVYETTKWYEATFSEYERCQASPGPTFLTAAPRPSDGLYCYYWNLYTHNRAIAWMIANAGLALGTLTCSEIDAMGANLDLICMALQRDFGLFTTEERR